MARIESLDSIPYTRQGKSPGGHRRALPTLGASGRELGKIHLNGELNPDATVEELRTYLGISELRTQGRSRNSR